MLITNILKQFYVKLGGNIEDVEDYTKVAPVLNEMLNLITPAYKSISYSQNEEKVGNWIDGKPIYQKTYYIDTITTGANLIDTPNYIDTLVSVEHILIDDSNAGIKYIESGSGNQGYNANTKFLVSYELSDNSELTFVCGSTVAADFNKAYITIRYTKVSDSSK